MADLPRGFTNCTTNTLWWELGLWAWNVGKCDLCTLHRITHVCFSYVWKGTLVLEACWLQNPRPGHSPVFTGPRCYGLHTEAHRGVGAGLRAHHRHSLWGYWMVIILHSAVWRCSKPFLFIVTGSWWVTNNYSATPPLLEGGGACKWLLVLLCSDRNIILQS